MSQVAFKDLEPLKALNEDRLNRLMSKCNQEHLDKRSRINALDERNWFVYLVDGEVQVKAPSRKTERFKADSDRALRPVFDDPGFTEIAITKTTSQIIKVDKHQFNLLIQEQEEQGDEDGIEVDDISVVDVEADIIRQLFEDYRSGKIPVPSIPETAMKVRKLVEDPDVGIDDLAALIENDPPIAGKVLAAGNSALVRGVATISTVRDALVRLGMKTSCNIVMSLSLKELFKFSNPALKNTAMDIWKHSVTVAAGSRLVGRHCSLDVDPDKAFLVGLLHDIGADSLLAYFDQLDTPISEFTVRGSLAKLRTMVSGMVLQTWHLDEQFIAASEKAGRWTYTDPAKPYCDVINIAKHQALLAEDEGANLPPLNTISAFASLANAEIDDDGQLVLMRDHPEIQATVELLK